MSDYNFSLSLICKINIKKSQIMNKNDVKQSINIRDEFHVSVVHRRMNVIGPVQSSGVIYFA